MKSLADVGPCTDCQRPNCPTLLALIHGTGGEKFTWRDSDSAKIECLTAQLAAERARADLLTGQAGTLREALRPFAALSDGPVDDGINSDEWDCIVTRKMFRDAQAALSGTGPDVGALVEEAPAFPPEAMEAARLIVKHSIAPDNDPALICARAILATAAPKGTP